MLNKLFFFTIAFFLSNFLFKRFISKSSKLFLDIPNKRSMHTIPTPRGGGIVFITNIIITSLIYIFFYGVSKKLIIPFLILPLGITGFIDDINNVSPKIKYIIQLITCFLIFSTSNLFLKLDFNITNVSIAIFMIIAFTAVINFVNFMDGIDGLVASCMFISIFTTCIVLEIEQSYIFLLGSLISFIILNWHPAKLFMGDSGSTFLAAINLSLICLSNDFIQAFNLLLVLSPLLIDPFICVIRRFMNKQEIFLPHKQHFYQRLNQAGWTHNKVSILYLICSLLISLSYFLSGLKFSIFTFMVCFSYCFWLNYKIAVPFKK